MADVELSWPPLLNGSWFHQFHVSIVCGLSRKICGYVLEFWGSMFPSRFVMSLWFYFPYLCNNNKGQISCSMEVWSPPDTSIMSLFCASTVRLFCFGTMQKKDLQPRKGLNFPMFWSHKITNPDQGWSLAVTTIAQSIRGIPIILAGSGKISGPSWQLFLGCDYRICSMDTAPWSAGLQMELMKPFGNHLGTIRATQGTQIGVVFQTGSAL